MAANIQSQQRGVGWVWMFLLQLAVMAAFAALCAAVVRGGCVDPGPPVDVPDPGTPRAGYCGGVAGGTPWLQFAVAPVVIVAAALIVLRRRFELGWLVVVLVIVALAANAVYAHSLEFAHTV